MLSRNDPTQKLITYRFVGLESNYVPQLADNASRGLSEIQILLILKYFFTQPPHSHEISPKNSLF